MLVALGMGAYVYQFVGGLGVTGMSNGTSWGLYIASFMFFVGLSAGGLIVASSASIFHVTEYKKVALPAIIVSLICICIAGAFVRIDLGGIVRILNLFASPNFVSPQMCIRDRHETPEALADEFLRLSACPHGGAQRMGAEGSCQAQAGGPAGEAPDFEYQTGAGDPRGPAQS